MLYLQIEHLLQMHSFVVDETGGLHGVRDRGRLESAIARPQQEAFGKELFPTIFQKGAAYAHSIITEHPFVDGNKRTGMTAAIVFLEYNDMELEINKGEIEKFALRIARERVDIPTIAAWLKRHAKKRRAAARRR